MFEDSALVVFLATHTYDLTTAVCCRVCFHFATSPKEAVRIPSKKGRPRVPAERLAAGGGRGAVPHTDPDPDLIYADIIRPSAQSSDLRCLGLDQYTDCGRSFSGQLKAECYNLC